jgi:hypothetical protein
MTTIAITEIIEMTSDWTYTSAVSISEGGYEARIEDLLELLEGEEDIHEGLKALADKEGTVTWEQYQQERARREPRGELPD